jgi:hypothetical protein
MRGFEVCMKELALDMKSLFLAKGDYLFHVGATNEHIYVILKGSLYISQNEKLETHADGTGIHDKPPEEGTGFSIPRNKEANAVDVMRMVIGAFKLREKKKKNDDQKKIERVSDLLKGPTLSNTDNDSDQDWLSDPAEDGEAVDILESHVDSRVLNAAFRKLSRRDTRLYKAAKYIQRRWRRNHGMTFVSTVAHKGLSIARSKYVHAPAYLGESCLWQPLDEWDTYQQFPYAARCVSRGEFCYMHRDDIKNIITNGKFSPWLGERFEYFRQSVLENIQKIEDGKQAGDVSVATSPSKDEAKMKVDTIQISASDADARRPSTPRDMATQEFWPQPSDAPVVIQSPMVSSSPREVACPLVATTRPSSYSTGSRGYGVGSTSPLGLVLSQRTASKHPSRTFRMAAQKAVARIAKQVNPPSADPTPRGTPRGTPRSSAEENQRPALQEPLLQRQSSQ